MGTVKRHDPVRIDLLTSLDGVEFEECYERRILVQIGGIEVPFIALDDLSAAVGGCCRTPLGAWIPGHCPCGTDRRLGPRRW